MSANTYTKKFSHSHTLTPTFVSLLDFSRQRITVQGCFEAPTSYNDPAARITFYIVPSGTTLVSLDAIASLDLSIQGISRTCYATSTVPAPLRQEFRNEFAHLFFDGIRLAKRFVHDPKISLDVTPVAAKLHHLLFKLPNQVERTETTPTSRHH